MNLQDHIRTVPDFPKPGIQFRDVTPLLLHADAFAETVRQLAATPGTFDLVAGIDARGFIFGAGVARALGVGFLPVRKAGKLPGAVMRRECELEYGSAALEVPQGLVEAGQGVLLVDDLIATGGTAVAAVELLREAGLRVEAAAFVVELRELMGMTRLRALDVPARGLVAY